LYGMNKKLVELAPDFCKTLKLGLKAEDRLDLSSQVDALIYQSWRYDAEVDASMVSVRGGRRLNDVEKNVIGEKFGESIPLESIQGIVVVDVDNFGRMSSIEVIGNEEIHAELENIAI
ncbi:MAG: hypothetical protein GY697_27740, partial [Desulfobacterales bacterium]|nr:hypothetical protein [Desulfobacterales bacterium]